MGAGSPGLCTASEASAPRLYCQQRLHCRPCLPPAGVPLPLPQPLCVHEQRCPRLRWQRRPAVPLWSAVLPKFCHLQQQRLGFTACRAHCNGATKQGRQVRLHCPALRSLPLPLCHAWPAGDGALQGVEDLEIDVVGWAPLRQQVLLRSRSGLSAGRQKAVVRCCVHALRLPCGLVCRLNRNSVTVCSSAGASRGMRGAPAGSVRGSRHQSA